MFGMFKDHKVGDICTVYGSFKNFGKTVILLELSDGVATVTSFNLFDDLKGCDSRGELQIKAWKLLRNRAPGCTCGKWASCYKTQFGI